MSGIDLVEIWPKTKQLKEDTIKFSKITKQIEDDDEFE